MKINNEHVILFIVKKRLHPCLRCIRYKHDIKTPSKQNMVGLNELKRIFAFLLNDSLKIMDNNLSALIFMISSHTLVAKLIQWKFIDYSSLSGYPHQAKLQQMKIENKGANDDIGYIFECCLNDSNINKSIFNHNINIPRYIIIEYLHQCILYLTPYQIECDTNTMQPETSCIFWCCTTKIIMDEIDDVRNRDYMQF